MKRTVFCLLILVAAHGTPIVAQEGRGLATSGRTSEGVAVIERAAAAEKFAFVFFWKEQNPQTDKAWSVLQPAIAQLADRAEVASVRVTDPAARELVARYDLSRTPMPLVLAIAPCGAVTKAFPGGFTEAQLQTAFVSPCTQLCLKAIQDQKLVLVCVVDQQSAREPVTLPRGVQEFKADGRFGPATEIVLIDASDEGESAFLQELQVDPRTPRPLTVFLAPPGSVIGKFDARATKEQFVTQLAAVQSNPCAGGKCGPNGCGPKKK